MNDNQAVDLLVSRFAHFYSSSPGAVLWEREAF